MANPEHVKIVRQGAAAIGEWRRQNPGAHLDVSGADLAGANLTGAHVAGANFSEADLTDAALAGADLTGANLREANLHGADLYLANLAAADLTGAVLAGADPIGANLTGTRLIEAYLFGTLLLGAGLSGAEVTGAHFLSAVLANCDLSQTIGLAAVNHDGPSSIGVDTLIESLRGAGNRLTPDLETFFLGAGAPRELLAALPQIVAEVEYHSCFISYGQPDRDFAKRLRDDLAARGVPCWLYDLDATVGERTWTEIGSVRRQADKMVVICSAAALIRDGVLKEIEEQIDEDPGKMIPISRDNLWREPGFQVTRAGRDLKPFLLDKNYADFSDESRYDKELQRLLTTLRRKGE
jgi:hypothetical protein